MNKIFLITILAFSIGTSTYSNVYAAKAKPVKNVVKQAEKFDFRKARWGMNKSQIKSSEKIKPFFEDEGRITYKDKMFETDVSINYFFEDKKLIKSQYLFDGTFTKGEDYITYFRKIKKNIVEKYGKAYKDDSKELDIMEVSHYQNIVDLVQRGEQSYEIIWDEPTTTVTLSLIGKNTFTPIRLFVAYNSKKLKEIDDNKEVKKSLF